VEAKLSALVLVTSIPGVPGIEVTLRLAWIVKHSLTYWSVHWSSSGEGETFWCRFVVVGLVRRGVPYISLGLDLFSDNKYTHC